MKIKVDGVSKFVPNNSTYFNLLNGLSETDRAKVYKEIKAIEKARDAWKADYSREKHQRHFNPYLYNRSQDIVSRIEEICEGASQVKSQQYRGLASYASMVKSWKVIQSSTVDFVSSILTKYEGTTPTAKAKTFWNQWILDMVKASNTEGLEGDKARLDVIARLARFINFAYQMNWLDRAETLSVTVNDTLMEKSLNNGTKTTKIHRRKKGRPGLVYSLRNNLAECADFDVKTYLTMNAQTFRFALMQRYALVHENLKQHNNNIEAYLIILMEKTDFIPCSPTPLVTQDFSGLADSLFESMQNGDDNYLQAMMNEDGSIDLFKETDRVYANSYLEIKGDWGMGVIPCVTEVNHQVNCGFDNFTQVIWEGRTVAGMHISKYAVMAYPGTERNGSSYINFGSEYDSERFDRIPTITV